MEDCVESNWGDCDIEGCTVGEDLGLVDRARKLGKEIAEKTRETETLFLVCLCGFYL